jgi:hypothetical protein
MSTAIGIFSRHADAENTLRELRAFGVKEENISYIYIDTSGKLVDEQAGEKIGNRTTTGITTGAVVGALLGFVVANGILPGVGSVFVAGPLATALGFTGSTAVTVGGAMTGAATGGLIGALTGIGVSDEDALLFEHYVRSGDVLIAVRDANTTTHTIFARAHAREVQEYPL